MAGEAASGDPFDPPRVFMRHVRAAGLCSQGSRAWCQHNGVDWSAFLAGGVAGEILLSSGDPIVARVVEAARTEAREAASVRAAFGASCELDKAAP